MVQRGNPSFHFDNSVSPRYLKPLFLQLEYGQWYSTAQFIGLLRSSGLDVKGQSIAAVNMLTWTLAGLGKIEKRGTQYHKKNYFQLTALGKQLIDTYSTNAELFYDLMHFLFYSTYQRSGDVRRGCFWLYANVCDVLWQEAPAATDTSGLTNRLQIESHVAFPGYEPSISDRSVSGVSPWLQALVPPFLSRQGTKSQLYSRRRSFCTPQLFQLATELVYTTMEGLQYGASLAIDERHIEAICRTCLLDIDYFWDMADVTQMTISGYELRRGQWGTSIALAGRPTWISLLDFADERVQEDMSEFEDGVEE